MQYNASNPLIPHASQSMQMQDYKMQMMINALARRIIRKNAKDSHAKRTYYIKDHAIFIL